MHAGRSGGMQQGLACTHTRSFFITNMNLLPQGTLQEVPIAQTVAGYVPIMADLRAARASVHCKTHDHPYELEMLVLLCNSLDNRK